MLFLLPSEFRVVELLVNGLNPIEISNQLKISRSACYKTIRFICFKSGVESNDKNRIEKIIAIARENGYQVQNTKLSPLQIDLIKQLAKDVTGRALAQRFAVSPSTISRVKSSIDTAT